MPWPARRGPVHSRRMAPSLWRPRRLRLGRRIDDELLVAPRIMGDRQVQDAIENEPLLRDRRRLKRNANEI